MNHTHRFDCICGEKPNCLIKDPRFSLFCCDDCLPEVLELIDVLPELEYFIVLPMGIKMAMKRILMVLEWHYILDEEWPENEQEGA